MAIPKFLEDLDIISKLGDYPGADDGLSTSEFKAKFDEAGNRIKEFLNNTLIPELDMMVDVRALINGILDSTLSQSDKAANAKVTGDALDRKLNRAGDSMTGYLSVPAPTQNAHAVNKGYVDTVTSTAKLTAAGWEGAAAPYTQSITVPGLTDAKRAMVYPAYSGTLDADRAMREACACVSYAMRSGSTITLYCLEEKPAADISVTVEVGV